MSLIQPDNSVPVSALLKRFALIYLPIVLVFSIALLSGIRRDEQARVDEIEGNESSRIAVAEGLIMQGFSVVSAELRVIASLPVLRRYLDSGNSAQQAELEAFFLVLSRSGQRYDQMRYLDASGQEVIRINYNDGQPAIVPREQLQNKSHRYYFRDTIKLNQGEIFVSPLDLNIEHGRVESPHKPMIRFGTPVFDSAGRKQGVIVLNYFGSNLLQRFHDAMQGGKSHSNMLLNREGYWLSGAKLEDEWSFMLGKNERSFRHDFAEAWRTISATEYGSLLTDQGLFVFAAVHPLIPGHRTFMDSVLPHVHSQHEPAANEYYWKIVTFVPRASLSGTALYNQPIGRVLQIVVYLLLALAAWIIALTTLRRKQAEEAFRESEEKFRTIIEATPVPIALNDEQGNITYLNQAFVQTVGYTTDDIPTLADWWLRAYPDPKYRKWVTETWQNNFVEAKRTNRGFSPMAVNVRCKDGLVRTFMGSATPLQANFAGTHLVILYDITERKLSEDRIQKSEAKLRTIIGTIDDLVWLKDQDGVFLACNAMFERLFGAKESEIIGKTDYDFVDKELADFSREHDRKAMVKDGPSVNEEWVSFADDGHRTLLETVRKPMYDNSGRLIGVLGIGRDITERKAAEEKINNLAFYDSLTQLPNRRLLLDRLHKIMATSKRSGRYGAVMFLDLDNFKPLNDTHGHDVGDLLLVEAARRIAQCVREMDTVARFGGDEFVVVLSELKEDQAESAAQARIVAEKIRTTLDEPYVLKFLHEEKTETTVEHHCTASIGVVLFVNHEAKAEDVLKWADSAMYQAKEAGRNQIRFHDSKA